MFMPWGGDGKENITVQSDSDWAGQKGTRKSVSGGAAYMFGVLVKSWSKEQTVIALSSGEAELYAANRAAREGLGLQTMAKEFGYTMPITVQIDASATEAMMQRRGLGKMRHLEVQDLWAQEAIQAGRFQIQRIASGDNTSDLGTKPLNRECLEKCVSRMGFYSPDCQKEDGGCQ